MKKEGKRITRWKTGITKMQGAAYLREMAENGWILEDMNHLTYSFREDEPQYLTYRLTERESYLMEEERAEYEKNGWQEVCHYEREYVFVKERVPFEEEAEIQRQEVAEEIDREITLVKKNNKIYIWIFIIAVLIGFVVLLMSVGVSIFNRDTLLAFVTQLGPNLLIILAGGWMTMRRLRKKKERVMEGDIPEEYTDWRSSRRTTIFLVAVLLIGLGAWVYYAAEFNEKTFDMPSEISYQEIPAVRLENLFDEPLTRAGESIDPKMEGFRVNPDMFEGVMYNNQKKLGGFDNYGVDHRFLLKMKEKVETYQCMQMEDGIELNMDTDYSYFRDIRDAGVRYIELCVDEEQMDAYWREQGMDFPVAQEISVESERIDNLHICRTDWTNEIAYHVVANKGSQVLELHYSGKD
ncbi:MAG: DUF2812 domain-containing protein, partial [Anaerotignum sp.]|nr:DUF2812 domain-containing protein [Anaerotignum sp.]